MSMILSQCSVIPGRGRPRLVPGIYPSTRAEGLVHRVDGRVRPGHDGVVCANDEAGEGAAR